MINEANIDRLLEEGMNALTQESFHDLARTASHLHKMLKGYKKLLKEKGIEIDRLRDELSKLLPKCDNPECGASSTIVGEVSFGSGELDTYGFWEKPCRHCAKRFEIIFGEPCWPGGE